MDQLSNLFQQSQRILITSHLGPDADSLCSSILLAKTLQKNYPDKSVTITAEDRYDTLAFLDGYNSIDFDPLTTTLDKYQPDLLVILDANNIPRCTREAGTARDYLKNHEVQLLIIDHHEPIDIEPDAIYINQQSPAVTEDVYEICFDQLGLERPENYAQVAMIGLYSDTGGFTYDNPRHKDTFKMASELISAGASAELAANQLTQYSHDGLEVLNELIANIKQTKDYTYTYISDEFYSGWTSHSRPPDAIHEGFDIFLHNFMRNIEGRFWGFAIYPDPNAKVKTYSVSFRSLQGRVDVASFARKLGGGGHRAAAGAKLECGSVQEALKMVKQAIENAGSV